MKEGWPCLSPLHEMAKVDANLPGSYPGMLKAGKLLTTEDFRASCESLRLRKCSGSILIIFEVISRAIKLDMRLLLYDRYMTPAAVMFAAYGMKM